MLSHLAFFCILAIFNSLFNQMKDLSHRAPGSEVRSSRTASEKPSFCVLITGSVCLCEDETLLIIRLLVKADRVLMECSFFLFGHIHGGLELKCPKCDHIWVSVGD